MHKRLILFLVLICLCLPAAFAEDTLTITTYYPSPYGVYKTLRLYPNDDNTPGGECANEGEIVFDKSESQLYTCRGTPSLTWQVVGGSIPAGAVLAFNLDACPSGWTEYTSARDRTIVGSGTTYARGATGGAATHTLSTAEMPSHSHGLTGSTGGDLFGSNPAAGTYHPSGSWSLPRGTDNAGGGGAHNNMQPYIALLYCQKD
ncbi:MAG: hypothetical protein PHO03_04735 [Candidatus Omnitrophica bacterium]|nr:hypothetical protein [Candidatus Omnitrophota bacterium]